MFHIGSQYVPTRISKRISNEHFTQTYEGLATRRQNIVETMTGDVVSF